MDQSRYFVGIALPEDITTAINALRHANYTGDSMLQPLIPHITLVHPNVLTAISPLYFLPRVREAAATFLPLDIRLNRIEWFDKRVLHIGVESSALHELHERLVSLLPEYTRAQHYVGRSYTPHVTLAQAKPYQTLLLELEDIYAQELRHLLPYSFSTQNLSSFTWQRPRQYTVKPL